MSFLGLVTKKELDRRIKTILEIDKLQNYHIKQIDDKHNNLEIRYESSSTETRLNLLEENIANVEREMINYRRNKK